MRFLAAVVIGACALPAFAAPAPEAARGMSASLRKLGSGAPVYLVLGARGVEARTADGKARRVVFEGKLDDALWDAQGEVLLLRRGDRVEALDPREARPKPRLLATRVPPVPASRLPLAADPRHAAPASLAGADSCGPYHVDSSGGWYLFQEFAAPMLCAFGGACAKVEGWPLGWLDPALVVGAEL